MTLHRYQVDIDIDDNVPVGVLEDAIAHAVRGLIQRKFFRVKVLAAGGQVPPKPSTEEPLFTAGEIGQIMEKLSGLNKAESEGWVQWEGHNVKPPREHPFDGPEVFDDMPADPFPLTTGAIDALKSRKR